MRYFALFFQSVFWVSVYFTFNVTKFQVLSSFKLNWYYIGQSALEYLQNVSWKSQLEISASPRDCQSSVHDRGIIRTFYMSHLSPDLPLKSIKTLAAEWERKKLTICFFLRQSALAVLGKMESYFLKWRLNCKVCLKEIECL